MALDHIINPIKVDDFFSHYWEKEPLLIERNQRDYFAGLLSSSEIEEMVSILDPKQQEFDIVNAHHDIKRSDFIDRDGRVDPASVFRLFDQGATLIFQRLHRRHASLAKLCAALERQFSHPFQTNIYFTPAGAKGFRTHYDTHDVFVLQLEGAKDWTLYDQIVELPLTGQDYDRHKHKAGDPTKQFRLKAGDMVYIPRGFMHDALSLDDEPSLHITVGALTYNWADFLIDTLGNLCLNDASFRKALPPGFAREDFDKSTMEVIYKELLQKALLAGDFDASFNQFKSLFLDSRRPLLENQLQQILRVNSISLDTNIQPRQNLIYSIRSDADGEDGECHIQCYGRIISLPLFTKAAIEMALSTKSFTPQQLPDTLDDNAKLVLVRRLVKEGLLIAQ